MKHSLKATLLCITAGVTFHLPQANAATTDYLNIGLSSIMSAGGSTVGDDEISLLQAGGHDPKRVGFNIQGLELSLASAVDPYFDGQANLVFLVDEHGESLMEIEEMFFLTRALPAGLQIKGGRYYTDFGRLNSTHPHTWWFVDQPIINGRLLSGDGLRSEGARVSWLMPLSWYSEIMLGAQNAAGETQISFIANDTEPMAGHERAERKVRSVRDMLYSLRWLNGVDINDTTSANAGISALNGPNNTGDDRTTQMLGADLYLKWQPATSQRGFPFVAWHSEWAQRRYQAGAGQVLAEETVVDQGYFTQLAWGFSPGWVSALRFEDAVGDNADISDAARERRQRLSASMTWFPSEFSKIRLQYNYDKTKLIADSEAHSVWLQVEYSVGSHMAHTF